MARALPALIGAVLAAAAMAPPPAAAQPRPASPPAAQAGVPAKHYEPIQRRRMGLECMRDEVELGINLCVKKCQREFRMDTKSSPVRCVAMTPNARYVPPKPPYEPPDKPLPPGAKGA